MTSKKGITARSIEIFKGTRRIRREVLRATSGEVSFEEVGPTVNQTLTNLGPTFVKLGQMLSLRPDIVPSGLADQLRNLLDHGTPSAPSEVRELFIREIKKPPEEVFEKFDTEPFAVASLAQVHKAKLNGQNVAVKIQHPHVHDTLARDLKFAKMIAHVIALAPGGGRFQRVISQTISEFFRWIEHELDYRLEALNLARVDKSFEEVEYFVVPDVFHEVSTKRVLTMEFIDGVSLNELFSALPSLPYEDTIAYKGIHTDKQLLIDRMVKVVYKQVFIDGVFHADPHPANILITKEKKVAFIDFGLTGRLPSSLKKKLIPILVSVVEREPKKIVKTFLAIDEVEGSGPHDEFERRVRDLLADWQSGSIIEMSMAQVFYRIMVVCIESDIDLPLSLIVIGKVLFEYDGVLSRLNPELDVLETLKPLAESQLLSGDSGLGMLGSLGSAMPGSVKELLGDIGSIPAKVKELARVLTNEDVEFTVRIGPHGIEPKVGSEKAT